MPGLDYINVPIKTDVVVGAVAGNITIPNIRVGDYIKSVRKILLVLGEAAPNTITWTTTDLTTEFKVTADNTINNAAGTTSAGGLLLVTWIEAASGRFDPVLGRFGE